MTSNNLKIIIKFFYYLFSGGGMPKKGARVTMMFSATFAKDVQQLAAGI